MFSDPYRGVKYFGQWAEETADAFGCRDALTVLQDAAERCAEEDMRTAHVLAALAYLSAAAARQGAFGAFRKVWRCQTLQAAHGPFVRRWPVSAGC